MLFISHRLEEVFAICQRVTIMRDGRFVRTDPIEDLDIDAVIRSMVGRDLDALFPKTRHDAGRGRARGRAPLPPGEFNDVSFTVRRGEIVALAGLVGAGRSEIARAIFGIDRYDAGRVEFDGNAAAERVADRRHARRRGLRARGPPPAGPRDGDEHRPQRGAGLVAATPARWVCCGAPPSASSPPSGPAVCSSSSPRSPTTSSTLSGGNQQKVVLGKWLARHPKLLIIDEPTRGIDVGTKAEVHRLLDELVADGIAVLMISSELPEVLGMADRVLVIHEGRLVAEIDRADADEARSCGPPPAREPAA